MQLQGAILQKPFIIECLLRFCVAVLQHPTEFRYDLPQK